LIVDKLTCTLHAETGVLMFLQHCGATAKHIGSLSFAKAKV